MGVPKFFRYISERYPCLSEVVKEYQIPEFDNLYLDMNGIIHNCSHPDDNNPHFRITEEKIFQDIFHYIEVLFRMIHPQKLFFMAVDGVAPRAKMNQQRGRRFRSAKEAQKMEAKAQQKGETLPDAARFDSNCITPGTEFMCKLQDQLKYFVVDKISNDPLWRKCKVILSGHETPGEGEHKIMDYIRYMRSQPDYDPNTRHCLYGLDADLIMLGLCTHDPHFSLLREEVKFSKKTSSKRLTAPEDITFYLLHLSLMREYLELEFKPLQDKLGFKYDFEKIIDDWVLMGFLVGNDFIPHLPNLHIAKGALPILYKAYNEVLPELGGYINEGGILNLGRFEKFLEKLATIDMEHFEELMEDNAYFESKTGRKMTQFGGRDVRQRELDQWEADLEDNFECEPLEPETSQKTQDSGLAALIKATDDMDVSSDNECEMFENFKRNYYRNKMEIENVTSEVMRDQAEGYVRAIQWNLHYYYNGCCSWSWYYPHHYAPYISDIKGFTDLKIEFEMGEPFKPFEQLLAVLPAASKNLLPAVYHGLMTDDQSIIKQYYPEDFNMDLNGKQQDWEAVVLVPFIDENLLLEAMAPCNARLSAEEQRRNRHGPMLMYTFTQKDLGPYEAPQYFRRVNSNHAAHQKLTIDDIRVPIEKLVKGAYPGMKQGVYYPGFPTMKHLQYEGRLEAAKIKVFDSMPSRNENMIIKIIPEKELTDTLPEDLVGRNIFVGWPHLVEAKVVAVSNATTKYVSASGGTDYKVQQKTGNVDKNFQLESEGITDYYKSRMGIECGETKVLVHVKRMVGRRYAFSPHGRINYDKQFAKDESVYPLQTVVYNIEAYDSCNTVFKSITSVFPVGCEVYVLTNPYYGSKATVLDSTESWKDFRLKICLQLEDEPDFTSVSDYENDLQFKYMTTHHCAQQLGMSSFLFSKITGSVYIGVYNSEGGIKNINGGLDLKFNKKNKEIPGYTKKKDNTWYYSAKAVELVRDYVDKFPEVIVFFSRNPKADGIFAKDIFGDEWESMSKDLIQYMRELPTASIEKRSCGSTLFEKELVDKIEEIVANHSKKSNPKQLTVQVKPQFLYRPEIQNGTLMPDPNMTAQLLDRVVNVRVGFSVPYGLKGTIIGIHKPADGNERDTIYDVLFDEPFRDGLNLNCSDNRGYKLPGTALINLTYGKRLMDERTGKSGELREKARQHIQEFGKGQPFFGQGQSAFAQVQQNHWFTQPRLAQQQQGFKARPPPVINREPAKANNVKNNKVAANGHCYFMPNFGKNVDVKHSPQKQVQDRQQNQTAPIQIAQRPNNRQNVPDQIQRQQREQVQATSSSAPDNQIQNDLLKKMLKIGTPDKTTSNNVENKLSISDIFANAPKAPATVQLMTYFQSNRLGLPRYQYSQNKGNVVAQLTLPNGKLICGKPLPDRVLASESVAEEALKELTKKTVNVIQSSNTMPPPPQTWVQPSTTKNDRQKVDSAVYTNSNLHHKSPQKRNSFGNNSFIPTQAMMRQAQKNAKSDNRAKPQTHHPKANTSAASLKENERAHSSNSTNKTERPKRERKSRIAANFHNK